MQRLRMARSRWIPLVALLAAFCLMAVLVRDAGVTWDEGVQAEYGELVLRYFQTGGQDTRCNSFIDLYYYGPLFETAAAVVYHLAPGWKFELRHLLCALSGLLAVWGTAWFAARLPVADRTSGVFAAWFLITLPAFFGHSLFNSKDIPFACAWVWAMGAWCDVLTGDRSAWRPWVRAGLLSGLVLALRPGGLTLLLCVALGLWVLLRCTGARPASGMGHLGRTGVALAIAWTVMVLPWPWAHEQPILHPLRAMSEASSFSAVYDVLFNGRIYASDALPRYYVPEYLLITLPPALLVFVAAGKLSLFFGSGAREARRHPSVLLLLAWAGIPIALAILRRPNLYDGLRHFLFILPAAAVLAGWGAGTLWSLLRRRFGAVAAASVVGALAVTPVVPLVRLHPYAYTYVSLLGGGMDGVHRRMETDYWLTSYREAAEWIHAHAEPGEDGKVVVWAAANGYSEPCIRRFLRSDIRLLTSMDRETDRTMPPHVDYYVGTTRYGLDQNYPDAPVVHTIGRAGAVFAVIKGRPAAPP